MPDSDPLNVLIVGGGTAALEAAFHLQRVAGHRVTRTILAPDDHFGAGHDAIAIGVGGRVECQGQRRDAESGRRPQVLPGESLVPPGDPAVAIDVGLGPIGRVAEALALQRTDQVKVGAIDPEVAIGVARQEDIELVRARCPPLGADLEDIPAGPDAGQHRGSCGSGCIRVL